jgi:hypothetical protein
MNTLMVPFYRDGIALFVWLISHGSWLADSADKLMAVGWQIRLISSNEV